MSDELIVDRAYVEDVRDDLTRLDERMASVHDTLRGMSGLAVGARILHDDVVEFADSWDDSLDEVREQGRQAGTFLGQVLEAFETLDLRLAEQLVTRERQG